MDHHIKINWTQESNFEYEENNQKISLDIVSEKGFSPKKLLLVGLAGCTGIDIVSLLEKMRVEFLKKFEEDCSLKLVTKVAPSSDLEAVMKNGIEKIKTKNITINVNL